MRLAVFNGGSGRRLGVLREGGEELVDLAAAAEGGARVPVDLLSPIAAGREGLDSVRAALAGAAGAAVKRVDAVELLAPYDTSCGNVLCIGRNYQKHAEEGAAIRGEEVKPPTIFSKAITSVAGPYAELPIAFGVSTDIDWEVELGVMIGTAGANIKRADALAHVFAYTVVNDISARDIQNGWGGQFFKGKSLDNSGPIGPFLVTADEVPDPQSLRLRCLVNGVVKQDANTRDMIYPVDAVIEWLSRGMTLLPGALIATGTPEGVGFARKPPEFLKPGDLLESEVEGVGTLRNRIASA